MIHSFTSHGTPLVFGQNDSPLSSIGVEQVDFLADHIQSNVPCHRILCSPEQAALDTASILSRHLKIPSLCIAELKKRDQCDFLELVAESYQKILAAFPDEDLLFVTSAEVCDILISLFELPKKKNTRQYDCALTTFNPMSWRVVPTVYDASYLPYHFRLAEGKKAEEWDREFFFSPYEEEIDVPDFSGLKGERVLHIGDTESATYPFYRELFQLTKPQVILHTGDVADELKMERHPEFKEEYKIKCAALIQMMRETHARMLFVIGNHDVPEILKELAPEAEFYLPGSEVILSGVPCRVGHKVKEMIFDRKYCLYGHGMSGESWRYAFNFPGKNCRFNVGFGTFLYDLANDRFVRLPRPSAFKR